MCISSSVGCLYRFACFFGGGLFCFDGAVPSLFCDDLDVAAKINGKKCARRALARASVQRVQSGERR